MSADILIKLAVQDTAALQRLNDFVKSADSGLKTLGKSSAAAMEEATTKIRGMSYYARSAIDSIRFAAEGSPRAAFYSIDEGFRGLLASGIKLSTLLPILVSLGGAIGLGYLAWRQFTMAQREAHESAMALAEALEKMPKLLRDIQTAAKSGLFPGIDKYFDYLTGAKKLFVASGDPKNLSETQFDPRQRGAYQQRPEATLAQVQNWVQEQLKKGGALDAKGNLDTQVAAVTELSKLEEKLRIDSLTGLDQEKAKISEKFSLERQEIEQQMKEAGQRLSQDDRAKANLTLEVSKQAEINALAAAEQKVREETIKKLEEARKKELEEVKQIEDQITRFWKQYDRDEAARARATVEYGKRVISEKQRDIQQSYNLTEAQKYTNLSGYREQKRPDPSSIGQQFTAQMVMLQNQWGTMAQNMAHVLTSTLATAVSSISNGITGLIMGTKTWGQALAQIGNQILTQIVSAIVEMGVKWVVTHVIMGGALAAFHALANALGWSSAAQVNAQEASKAPALATNAATASTSSFGAAALIGIAALIAGIGIITALSAREYGGPVSSGRPYIVGEKRPELFVPSENGFILPSVPSPGSAFAGSGSGGGQSINQFHVVMLNDMSSVTKHIRDNPDVHKIIIDVSKKNAHFIGARA